MPELRPRMMHEAGASPHARQGFWIRASTPAAAVTQRKQAQRVTGITNKENINLPRRSQLPAWYPRVPLGDITHIVQALERSRRQVRRAQPNFDETAEASPESEVLQSSFPLLQDSNTSAEIPPPDDSSATSSSLTVATLHSISPTQHPQEAPYSSSSSTACFSPSELSSEIELASPEDMQTAKYEKKLEKSIDEIEKAVSRNLKRPTMVAAKKTTGALMSMR